MGRKTMPLQLGQNTARASLAVALFLWSVILPRAVGLSLFTTALSLVLSGALAARFYFFRSQDGDRFNYQLYNVGFITPSGICILRLI